MEGGREGGWNRVGENTGTEVEEEEGEAGTATLPYSTQSQWWTKEALTFSKLTEHVDEFYYV